MESLLASVGILVASGILALVLRGASDASSRVGAGGVVVACALAAGPVCQVLSSGQTLSMAPLPWPVPNGAFVVGLDLLSAWFLMLVLIVPPLAAVFGVEFLKAYAPGKSLGATWFFYNLVIAGMMMVTIARDGLLFLMAWEVMALASYFLIVFEHEREEVREAGWTYLVASHMGTAFLVVLFIVLAIAGVLVDIFEYMQTNITVSINIDDGAIRIVVDVVIAIASAIFFFVAATTSFVGNGIKLKQSNHCW